jgi:hypothetical protein
MIYSKVFLILEGILDYGHSGYGNTSHSIMNITPSILGSDEGESIEVPPKLDDPYECY